MVQINLSKINNTAISSIRILQRFGKEEEAKAYVHNYTNAALYSEQEKVNFHIYMGWFFLFSCITILCALCMKRCTSICKYFKGSSERQDQVIVIKDNFNKGVDIAAI